MQIGFWQILVIVLLLVLLFGRGKISALMGDVAQGIKNFKKGMAEDTPTTPPAVTDAAAPTPTQTQPAATSVTPPANPSTSTTTPVPTAGASVAPNSTTPDTRAS